MTTNKNQPATFTPDHSTFGGEVHPYDFDGHPTMSDIASRILSDACFDKSCEQNSAMRNQR